MTLWQQTIKSPSCNNDFHITPVSNYLFFQTIIIKLSCSDQFFSIFRFLFLLTASFGFWEEHIQQLQLCLEFDNYFYWSFSGNSSPYLLGTLRYRWSGIQRSSERTASIGTSLESASFLCKRIWSGACAITVSRKSKINGAIIQNMLHIWLSTV